MRAARRDRILSAAQVAYHFGGYTLETAVELTRDERQLLLAIAYDEQRQMWDRLGRMLGTTWDVRTLAGIMDEKKADPNAPPKPIPSVITIPLLMAAAPEFFKAMTDEYKSKYRHLLETMTESGGSPVVEMSTLSSEQVRDIYARIGGMIAAAKPEDPNG